MPTDDRLAWTPPTRALHCPLCGVRLTPRNRSKDHFFPKSRGGARHDDLNCWTICRPCNNKKGNRAPSAREIEAFARVKSLTVEQVIAALLDKSNDR